MILDSNSDNDREQHLSSKLTTTGFQAKHAQGFTSSHARVGGTLTAQETDSFRFTMRFRLAGYHGNKHNKVEVDAPRWQSRETQTAEERRQTR